MADDDFDIDIYGDTEEQPPSAPTPQATDPEFTVKTEEPLKEESDTDMKGGDEGHSDTITNENSKNYQPASNTVDFKLESNGQGHGEEHQQIKSTDESGKGAVTIPKQAPQQQGTKRKEGSDERPIDPGATTAILVSDLHWWNTDDDVRGWVNQANCEDELKDITFSEHKVNGKSKGQAYLEFTSQQAATATKHKIESFGEGQQSTQHTRRPTATYSNPNINPFKTLPKDVPAKTGRDMAGGRGGYSGPGYNNNFRGRGNFRGGMNNMGGGFRGGFQGGNIGMNNMGGGFQQPMGGFNQGNFNGGFNRGSMMNNNIRGGRGGMRGGMSNNMGMGNMSMGGMSMGGMPNMPMGGMQNMGMGAMGAGFPMQPHFNPAFFPQNQGAGDWQNPHGAKRPRPE